ncbi:MAG: MotA/TolQ/ExbB proton channel family protein [Deltaproteobacteria bacterium]|nr:MotA/TolQ/ExbB proton channel family protein [Deltaproteobacteria bacterium]
MQAALVQLLLVAQEAAAHQEATGLKAFYHKVGWPFFVNMFIIVIVLAIITERTIYLATKFRVNSRELLAQVKKLVVANNIDRAIKLCEAADVPLLRVFRAGLMQVNRGDEAVVTAVEEQTMEIEPAVNKRVGALWSLANIGTLLGLLGTIFGLINTFAALDRIQDPARRQQALANGIAEAMLNTAIGLSVALVCMTAHLLISGQTKKILTDLEQTSAKLVNLLTTQREGS